MKDNRRLTVLIIPDGETETRTYGIPYARLKLALGGAGVILVVFIVMAASWWYVAAQAARVPGLERQVELLEGERAKVAELARMLSEVEAQYEKVRQMLGADGSAAEGEPVLPPLRGAEQEGGNDAASTPDPGSEPEGWPLTQSGFVTQPIGDGTHPGGDGTHPGVDIAVPLDSYIRAAGSGLVRETGRSDVYGRYLVIDHGGAYTSLYGHASQVFVRQGDRVERGEVIGLTGSTGRSTAPHLHFEIHHDGQAIDPFTMVGRRSIQSPTTPSS
ncbi:MAG: M23 family metallopeptidase [Longimicrobiales bacterium]